MVYRLSTENTGKIDSVKYYDKTGVSKSITGRIFVVACQASEQARLLLMYLGSKPKYGLANNTNHGGKNLIYFGGGSGNGYIRYKNYNYTESARLKSSC